MDNLRGVEAKKSAPKDARKSNWLFRDVGCNLNALIG